MKSADWELLVFAHLDHNRTAGGPRLKKWVAPREAEWSQANDADAVMGIFVYSERNETYEIYALFKEACLYDIKENEREG